MPKIWAEELRRICRQVFERVGATPNEAKTVGDLLVDSNLAGHDSHGIIRLSQYVAGVESGKIKPGATLEVEKETSATAVLNGNWGFGHVTAVEAMRMAIQKARNASLGVVAVHRCNHVGRLGGYPSLAAAKGMIGIVSNNGHGSDLSMAPWGGVGRILPANCLAVAFPSNRAFPVLLDLTTAVAAGGKVRVALARGESIPEGWLVDPDGHPTTDPTVYLADPPGALVPFGGQVGHKGSGLAFVLDILSGALSPAGCSRVNSEVIGNALFVQAIRIEAFRNLEEFRSDVAQFIDHVKSSQPAKGFTEVMIPGERSYFSRKKALAEGVVLDSNTWENVREIAENLGVGV